MQASTNAAASHDFSEIYSAYFDHVWTYLRRLGVPAPLLDDAVQDVFVVCHRRLPEFEGRSTIRTWLFGIARRIAFRYHRREARVAQKHAAMGRETSPARSHLDDDIHRAQAGALLHEFLESLDDDKREVFVLAELESYSRTQLGEALGISPGTAYNRLRAARRRFEERFQHSPWQTAVRVCAQRPERVPEGARQRSWAALVPLIGLGDGGPGSDAPGSESGGSDGTTAPTAGAPSEPPSAVGDRPRARPDPGGAPTHRAFDEASPRGSSLAAGAAEGGAGAATPWLAALAIVGVVGGGAAVWATRDPVESRTEPTVAEVATDPTVLGATPSEVRDVPPRAASPSAADGPAAPLRRREASAALGPRGSDQARGRSAPTAHAPEPSGSAAPPLTLKTPASLGEGPRVADEVQLLERAHQLAGQPSGAAAALALLQDHERRFPSSAFEQERRASRVVALCHLGRGSDARREADRLRARFPAAAVDDSAFARCNEKEKVEDEDEE
ncbi:MAG: sigma-70 family RNA polymerase sigma factor [Myxococcales bacterium FL481]|nr:MAG: sigma-70 family RNA polymerase sigma factor [Myxococcales bacterium FL481]